MAALLLAAPSYAKPKLRVIFVCTQDVPCKLFQARLKGQTSDLSIEVIEVNAPQEQMPVDDFVPTADSLAQTHQAAVAIWWHKNKLMALLRAPSPGRVLERSAALTTNNAELSTADLEAGSLVARTAIVAALNGTPIGVARETKPGPPPPPIVAAPVPEPSAAARAPWHITTSLGGNALWDDLPTEPSYGLELRAAAQRKRWRLGAFVIKRRQVIVSQPEARGAIDSWQPGVFLGLDVWRQRRLSLAADVRFGWQNTTVEALSGPFAESHRFSRKYVGLGLQARYELITQKLAAWAAFSLDRVEDPFSVGVRTATQYTPRWYVAKNQPSVGLGLEWIFSNMF